MRKVLASLLPVLAILGHEALAEGPDDALQAERPLRLAEGDAEARSQAAWEALSSQVPDLDGSRQTSAARAVPKIEDVATPRTVCFKEAVLGTYIRRRVCLSQEQWLSELARNGELRDALREGLGDAPVDLDQLSLGAQP